MLQYMRDQGDSYLSFDLSRGNYARACRVKRQDEMSRHWNRLSPYITHRLYMHIRIKPVRLVLLVVALLFLWYFKIIGLAYYWLSMKAGAQKWEEKGIWLPQYQVTLERLPVQGLVANASGLTFNAKTGTLFAVINRPPQVAELSRDGRLLRLISITDLRDPEGITHVRDNLYIIADERESRLHWVRIDPSTESIALADGPRLKLAIDEVHNAGLEGVSWDHTEDRLFLVKEKMPLRILVIDGLQEIVEQGVLNMEIAEWKPSGASSLFMADLSSLTFHEPTGNMLLLSDESKMVVEYAPDGVPVSIMPLWRGHHGLTQPVPQAEGITMGPDGAIYILSEPNLFYRFEPKSPPAPLTGTNG
jgi:uncharacterized protein YjiK